MSDDLMARLERSLADICHKSKRVDGPYHSGKFDGDDPYTVCVYCGQRRDALTGRIIRETRSKEERWSLCQRVGCGHGPEDHFFGQETRGPCGACDCSEYLPRVKPQEDE